MMKKELIVRRNIYNGKEHKLIWSGTGKLYEFKSAYPAYINVVNLMARVCADYMGIGDVNSMMAGSGVKLNQFDYHYFF